MPNHRLPSNGSWSALMVSALLCGSFSMISANAHPKAAPSVLPPQANPSTRHEHLSETPGAGTEPRLKDEEMLSRANPETGKSPTTEPKAQELTTRPSLVIPRVNRPPKLEDFPGMKPSTEMAGMLTKVDGFFQVMPKDSAPASLQTEAYLGYDAHNLYVTYVAFDPDPGKIRAAMTKREAPGFFDDDILELRLDTFDDHRRSYYFAVNPYGIQADALWPEGEGGFDLSYDTLWHSRGRITDQGYIVALEIPFKSLRFRPTPQQTWGIYLGRLIPRLSEGDAWPLLTKRIPSLLSQTARLDGLENISPGRNIQLIPYGILRSFHELDQRDPSVPAFLNRTAASQFGLDSKIVFKDSLVVDVTVNPDFSQVESDDPQVTVNQRFEVFFPEKRPFFLENANYFQTPINLVFTRRIINPKFGVRLTGKEGHYGIGVLLANDESPGKTVSQTDPFSNKKAYIGIARITRDIFKQSTIGFIYTQRTLGESYNRVGGIDGRFKLGQNWIANFQAAHSVTKTLDGKQSGGMAYNFELNRSGRQFNYNLTYMDRSPGFHTELGFEPRVDIRRIAQNMSYRWRPEGKILIAWGPNLSMASVWDHSGTRLDRTLNPSMTWELGRQTTLTLDYSSGRERLRPQDFATLTANRDFSAGSMGFTATSSYFPKVTFLAQYTRGSSINFFPLADGQPPSVNTTFRSVNVTLRPFTNLQIDNTYLESQLTGKTNNAQILRNRIIRTRWNWQFNRKLSLRIIPQYATLSVNQELTSLETTRSFNADALLAYSVNPWTSIYVGYNSNLQNLDLIPDGTGLKLVRTKHGFLNDSRQVYIKVSYLFRF